MPNSGLDSILQRVEVVAREVVAAESPAVDRDCRWPEASLRALQRAGLGGLIIGRDCGGLGQGLLAVAKTCEILGKRCGSTSLCFGMHLVASAVIVAKATPEQKQRYLVPIAAGRHLTTLALSEPGSGAHFYFPQTELRPEPPDALRIVGRKSFVTSGGHADSYVVSTTAADPDAPPDQFSCAVVAGDAAGLRWAPPWAGVGMRGNSSRALELDVVLPRRDLLGEEGDQMWYIFNIVGPYFLVAMAGTYLGIATAALEEVVDHLGKRSHAHSGASLAQYPVVQHRVGQLWAAVERSRRLVYHAAAAGDEGAPDALPAIMACKAEVSDCAVGIANEALTLLGGIAYREGSRADRLLRDARAAHVMAPTTDILRIWTGRLLLGQPLLGD